MGMFSVMVEVDRAVSGTPSADAGGRIGTVYGVYDEEAGVGIRGSFLIDPDGVIQAMEVLTTTVGHNVAELIRQVMRTSLNLDLEIDVSHYL